MASLFASCLSAGETEGGQGGAGEDDEGAAVSVGSERCRKGEEKGGKEAEKEDKDACKD